MTNRDYVHFLNKARNEGLIDYVPTSPAREVIWAETGNVLLRLDQQLIRVKYVDSQTGFGVSTEFPDHPVTGASWHGANRFCFYFALRLPTEIEWELAARARNFDLSDDGTYLYPWFPNAVINGSYANYLHSGDPFKGQLIATTPVGGYDGGNLNAFPTENAESPIAALIGAGTHDQVGNVAEWVEDWYDSAVYDELLEYQIIRESPRNYPQGPDLRVTGRRAALPETQSARIGFRTAYAIIE